MKHLCVFQRQIFWSTIVTVMMLRALGATRAGDQPGLERVPNAFFPMNFERHDPELASSPKLQARLLRELGYDGTLYLGPLGGLSQALQAADEAELEDGRGFLDSDLEAAARALYGSSVSVPAEGQMFSPPKFSASSTAPRVLLVLHGKRPVCYRAAL